MKSIKHIVFTTFAALILFCAVSVRAADPLPSWNDGTAKQAIMDFVSKVTKDGGPEFVQMTLDGNQRIHFSSGILRCSFRTIKQHGWTIISTNNDWKGIFL